MVDEVQEKEEWELKTIDAFDGGLNSSRRSNALKDNQLSAVSNLFTKQDRVMLDTGYTTLGAAVRGYPHRPYQFYKTTGASELVLLTTATFYVWNTTESEWQYVSDGTDTQANGGEPAGETDLVVDDITGFSDADYIGVILDDGTQHQTTINGAPSGSTIVMTDAVPVGRSISDNAAVVKAIDLTGNIGIQPDYQTIPDSDELIVTNGVDAVKTYNGTTIAAVSNLPSSGDTVCKSLGYFNNHLLLENTIEGGTAYPQRVRRSDTADITNWTTGNAGFNDLTDGEDSIMCSANLGPYHIIYKEKSIVRCEWVGTADKLFDFITTVAPSQDTDISDGAISQGSVVAFEDYHVLVGSANVYEYRGGLALDTIGNNIYYTLFGASGEINPSVRSKVVATYIKELDEVWILYPSGSDTVPQNLARYHRKTRSWWLRSLGDDMLGIGFFQRNSAKSWSELTGSWTDQDWAWNSVVVLANSPTVLFCGYTDQQVFEYDYTTGGDDGSDLVWSMETKDFYHKHFFVRLNMVEMLCKGDSITVSYSTDRGGSWNTYGTVTPGAIYTRERIWNQVVGRPIRFRFNGTGGGFGLEWFAFEFALESEW